MREITRKTGLLKARVPDTLVTAVEEIAVDDGVPVSHIIREAVEIYVLRRRAARRRHRP